MRAAILSGLCLTLFLATALPAEDRDYPQPESTKADEPKRQQWSAAKAGEYLDAVGVNWTRDRQCITCHTNLPYLMARSRLPGSKDGLNEVRRFLDDEVKHWAEGGKVRGDTYVVATATALVFTDRHGNGELSDSARQALDRMWQRQKPSGEWNWLKCDWPPMEHDDYYGAVLAAIAVGYAPDDYAKSESAQTGLAKLKTYLRENKAPDLHHQAHLLWASQKLDGLLDQGQQQKVIDELLAKQKADGGWSLPSLGHYLRRDKSENDADAPSDGYATGLVLVVLHEAGLSKQTPAVQNGIDWLKTNQRESGRWYTRSLNNDKAHYITNAGTAFAALALASYQEILPPDRPSP